MSWPVGVLAFACGLAGLAILGRMGWTLYRRVRHLGSSVAAASERIAEAAAAIELPQPEHGMNPSYPRGEVLP